jgi:hypothetical protein
VRFQAEVALESEVTLVRAPVRTRRNQAPPSSTIRKAMRMSLPPFRRK